MHSEFTLEGVATELDARLKTVLPGWQVRNADAQARTNALAVSLTYEQLGIATEYEGQRLAPGWCVVAFQLVLSAPETDPQKGTARLFQNLPTLCRALDAMDDLVWSTAEKGRDNSGTFYSLPISVFTHYPEPETPGDPEPEEA